MDFAIDSRLAHTPGDQLRDLRAEVDDEDEVMGHAASCGAKSDGGQWRSARGLGPRAANVLARSSPRRTRQTPAPWLAGDGARDKPRRAEKPPRSPPETIRRARLSRANPAFRVA